MFLLLSSVLTITPRANGQQFATSTSFLTSSITQTMSSYSTVYYSETSVGITTSRTTFQLASQRSCYEWAFQFNSTGNIIFSYVASGPMIIYLIDKAATNAYGILPSIAARECDSNTLASMAYTTATSGHGNIGLGTIISIPSISDSMSGSFYGTLFPFYNPWTLVVLAPISNINPSLTLTYGAVLTTLATTETASFSFCGSDGHCHDPRIFVRV